MFFGEPRGFWRSVPALLLSCLALVWTAFVNRDAFYLSDTTAYARGADAAIYRATGKTTQWSDAFIAREKVANSIERDRPDSKTKSARSPANTPVVLAGRSVYYGLLLYLSTMFGGFALAIAVQALCAAACAMLTVHNLRVATGRVRTEANPLVLLPALALLTPLAYFVCYMVPDLFAGIGVLAVLNLTIFGANLSRSECSFWFVMLCAALLMHSANVVIVGLLVVSMGLAVTVRLLPLAWRLLLLPVAALLLALGGEAMFSAGVENTTGAAPIRPPFLTARLIADGPGKTYLAANCGDDKFLLCRWRDRLPDASDAFLWDRSPAARGFGAATVSEQRRLAAEEPAFILAVVRYDPRGVARTTFAAVKSQATKVGLPEFNYGDAGREFYDRKVPPALLAKMRNSLAYRDAMPVQPVAALSLVTFLIASAFGLWVTRPRSRLPWEARAIFALAVLSVGIDIAVCGALSTPHDRYLMRILWIVPLIAFALLPDGQRSAPRRRTF